MSSKDISINDGQTNPANDYIMHNFNQIPRVVFAVGRNGPAGIQLLGTAFCLNKKGLFATASHVVGTDDTNLVLAYKELADLSEFQDTADSNVKITASAANTFRFGTVTPTGDKTAFLTNVKAEVRAFLCGDKKYTKERAGLFGEKAPTRTMVTSSLAVAIAPHIGVTAVVLAPIIALVLASLGAIALNAWCATTAPNE